MGDNVLHGPWPERRERRSLASLAALTGSRSAGVVVDPKPIDPSLLTSLSAKLECFASLARSLASEAKSLHRTADATALETVASVMEDRSAGIALDLGLFE